MSSSDWTTNWECEERRWRAEERVEESQAAIGRMTGQNTYKEQTTVQLSNNSLLSANNWFTINWLGAGTDPRFSILLTASLMAGEPVTTNAVLMPGRPRSWYGLNYYYYFEKYLKPCWDCPSTRDIPACSNPSLARESMGIQQGFARRRWFPLEFRPRWWRCRYWSEFIWWSIFTRYIDLFLSFSCNFTYFWE